MILYHGSKAIIKFPEVRKVQPGVSFGFCCTKDWKQANDGQYDMEKQDM